jgi:hypothetical protein
LGLPLAAIILSALARLQGAATAYFYPAESATSLFAQLEARGFATDRHKHFWGGESALAASRRSQEEFALPADLTILAIDSDTRAELVSGVAQLRQSCGVMPVPGLIMRG